MKLGFYKHITNFKSYLPEMRSTSLNKHTKYQNNYFLPVYRSEETIKETNSFLNTK